MRYVLLPFFLVRLLFVIIPGFIRLGLYQIPPLGALVISLLFFLYVLALTQPFFTPFLPLVTPTRPTPPLQRALSPQAKLVYQTALENWEKLYFLQPSHRDVLINLALLHQALGHEKQYQEYWARAQQLDPNSVRFSN